MGRGSEKSLVRYVVFGTCVGLAVVMLVSQVLWASSYRAVLATWSSQHSSAAIIPANLVSVSYQLTWFSLLFCQDLFAILS